MSERGLYLSAWRRRVEIQDMAWRKCIRFVRARVEWEKKGSSILFYPRSRSIHKIVDLTSFCQFHLPTKLNNFILIYFALRPFQGSIHFVVVLVLLLEFVLGVDSVSSFVRRWFERIRLGVLRFFFCVLAFPQGSILFARCSVPSPCRSELENAMIGSREHTRRCSFTHRNLLFLSVVLPPRLARLSLSMCWLRPEKHREVFLYPPEFVFLLLVLFPRLVILSVRMS